MLRMSGMPRCNIKFKFTFFFLHMSTHTHTHTHTHSLQELNNPMLYLDIMRWCWQQDFRSRPSAALLSEVLTNPSIPYLLDAVPLNSTDLISCACICTLPFELVSPGDPESSMEGLSSSSASSLPATPSATHVHVARGDLQEELWLATFSERDKIASIVVLNFKGKAVQVRMI